ncbi:diacylglycerol/lipid kinase family protein [Phenylobacterium montanum]|uniref:diacylglycerol/lipid kinase family protein n=1 Tax=Phenylobacterium montanum TaxID=2823693 RepID=UPI0020134006|nr:diacylglycerol kinase family protein [Caulobacter sp. S6]
MQPDTHARPSARAAGGLGRIRRVEVVVNPSSGGVDAETPAHIEALLAEFGLDGHVTALDPGAFEQGLQAAIDAGPDLLVTLAGDGTANRAAALCGPDGPVLAPLPGGTMNLLPRALYGRRAWPEALAAALSEGEVQVVSGGEVGGHPFHCAAILGTPALWAPAREAVRSGDLAQAWRRAAFALREAFARHLHFRIGEGHGHRAVALGLICPLVSRASTEDAALEAAVLDLQNATDVFRLGLYDIFSDWRHDPAVTVWPCVHGRAWARDPIPCLIDGEMVRLGRSAEITFRPRSFRALVPPPEPEAQQPEPEP